ncbi:MAG: hypothetical protein ACYTGF_00435 [Planctomycetota bacterium]|jgi:hypothetical protein
MTQHGRPNELCPQDQRLLDTLVDCGFDREAMEALTPDDQRRVDSLVSLFELLDDYPVEDADESLVHATLARVDRCEEQRASRMAISEAAEANELPARSRIRMPDFVSIAAVILIGASIVWPLTSYLNRRSIDTGCANNMRRMGLAFDQYASDFDGAMPIAQAGMFSNWNTTRHNTVNLDPLLQGGYCGPGDADARRPQPAHRRGPGRAVAAGADDLAQPRRPGPERPVHRRVLGVVRGAGVRPQRQHLAPLRRRGPAG